MIPQCIFSNGRYRAGEENIGPVPFRSRGGELYNPAVTRQAVDE